MLCDNEKGMKKKYQHQNNIIAWHQATSKAYGVASMLVAYQQQHGSATCGNASTLRMPVTAACAGIAGIRQHQHRVVAA